MDRKTKRMGPLWAYAMRYEVIYPDGKKREYTRIVSAGGIDLAKRYLLEDLNRIKGKDDVKFVIKGIVRDNLKDR